MKLFRYLASSLAIGAISLSALLSFSTYAGTAESRDFSRLGVSSYTYSSDVLNRDYVIDVILPRGFNPADTDTKYPVIYILDGYVQFPMVGFNLYQEQLPGDDGTSKLPKAIIVGIEQPITRYDWRIRTLDMTPTAVEKNGTLVGGGADNFLTFLNTELKPFINTTYSGDENNETLLGHSLGGLFGLYTMFTQPDSFDRYVIGSPTTWWDNDYIFTQEAIYAANNNQLNKSVYLFVGSTEVCNELGELCGVKDVRKMHRRLKHRSYSDLKIKRKILRKENHHSVIAPGFDRGVEFVMNENN